MKILWVMLLLAACGGNAGDIVVPAPAVLRTDLYYGYYGGGQSVLEALPHTNIIFESGLFGPEAQLNVIEAAKLPTILDIDAYVYYGALGTNRKIRPDIENALRVRLNELRDRNLLQYIIALYPIDEPNNTIVDAATIVKANGIVRRIASEYLPNVKLAAIYSRGHHFPGIASYDWIGFDHYENTSGIFANGEYQNLLNALSPGQRTLLVPGGALGQDITPFLNFAQRNPEVIAIIPFIWWDEWEPGAKGIRSNGKAQSYCLAGMEVKYPNQIKQCT